MIIVSWNLNGLRAILKKDFKASLLKIEPDILCLQETKAQDQEVKTALSSFNDYHLYVNSADKKGYSGTATLTKSEPLISIMKWVTKSMIWKEEFYVQNLKIFIW